MIQSLLIKLLLFLVKGGEEMVAVYCTLIIKGAYTFEQVPDLTKPAVEDTLRILGYGTDGVPLLTS